MTKKERNEIIKFAEKLTDEELEKEYYKELIYLVHYASKEVLSCGKRSDDMTNADKIRAMSNQEIAEFIYNVSNGATKISTCEEKCASCEYSDDYCIYMIGEWLISESQ